MRISYQFIAIGILYLMPLTSMGQEVAPYAKSEVKVNWVRGTDFSQYKTYVWGTTRQVTPDTKHPIETLKPLCRQRDCIRWGWTKIPVSLSLLAVETSSCFRFRVTSKIRL